tara:strand:- start:5672 stop:6223 length:552 start_codon:yes stop_codon:yes gene_type:complete
MANKAKSSKNGARPTGKGTALMIVCGGFAFVIAALPTVIVLLIGMIPSIVAYIIDLTPGRYAARCVAGLNIAGVVPFLNRMWTSTNDLPAAMEVVTDVYAWLAFYAASGVGWMLFVSLPSFVASFKTYSAKRRANALRERLDKLKDEWGEEITGTVPDSSAEAGSAPGSAGGPAADAESPAPA